MGSCGHHAELEGSDDGMPLGSTESACEVLTQNAHACNDCMLLAGAHLDNDIVDMDSCQVPICQPPSKKRKGDAPIAAKRARAIKPSRSKANKPSMPSGEMLQRTALPHCPALPCHTLHIELKHAKQTSLLDSQQHQHFEASDQGPTRS